MEPISAQALGNMLFDLQQKTMKEKKGMDDR